MNRRKFLQTAGLGLAGLLVVAPKTKAIDKVKKVVMSYKIGPPIQIFELGQLQIYNEPLVEHQLVKKVTIEYESGKIIQCVCKSLKVEEPVNPIRKNNGSYFTVQDVMFKNNELTILYSSGLIYTLKILRYVIDLRTPKNEHS